MSKQRILIIDDEHSELELLKIFLTRQGYEVQCATTATEGLSLNISFNPSVIILDIHLPDIDGLEVLRKLKNKNQNNTTIMITAYHDMETTVKAMKLGACDYITKPIDVKNLGKAIDRAFKLIAQNKQRDLSIDASILRKGSIIGNSSRMTEIFKEIAMLSENSVTVLIEGETGTGKELIAKAIHNFSPKRDQPFLAVNCSAIVETLLESELFGHEKGAFTGALWTKKGKFELAAQGTIFLDEVGDIVFELQAKLLRFLQEREFNRVGGEKTLKSEARVIAATNRNLGDMVKKGTFREDLYYRLNVARIYVPPLRERKEDIPAITDYLLKKICAELGKSIRKVEEDAIMRMTGYAWPGNVRQLENVLTRAAILTRGEVMTEETVLSLIGGDESQESDSWQVPLSLEEVERDHILKTLKYTNWRMTKTAHILGISRPTLRLKMREYDLLQKR
jgi:two-component system response regulator AtoC